MRPATAIVLVCLPVLATCVTANAQDAQLTFESQNRYASTSASWGPWDPSCPSSNSDSMYVSAPGYHDFDAESLASVPFMDSNATHSSTLSGQAITGVLAVSTSTDCWGACACGVGSSEATSYFYARFSIDKVTPFELTAALREEAGSAGYVKLWADDILIHSFFSGDSQITGMLLPNVQYELRARAEADRHSESIHSNGPYDDETSFELQLLSAVACASDTDNNGFVDVDDLVAIILDWSTDGMEHGGDVNGSGNTDVDDLIQVILDWGTCL